MATKSFLKEIKIKDNKSAEKFLSALENASGKGKKQIDNFISYNVTEKEKIKKIFGE